MKSKIAAAAAIAGLLWGTAHAAPDTPIETLAPEAQTEALPPQVQTLPPDEMHALPEGTEIIILEIPALAGTQGAPQSEHEQMMLGMLLLQLLSGMQAEGESMPVIVTEPPGERI